MMLTTMGYLPGMNQVWEDFWNSRGNTGYWNLPNSYSAIFFYIAIK